MVKELIEKSGHPSSGFYLNETEALAETLKQLESKKQRTLLIGVTFALLDFASSHPQPLQYTTLIETGGMKGRAVEITREEVHTQLKNAFHLPAIASEYGMTELLSQAWSKKDGLFECPSWMKVLVREEEDPLTVKQSGSGGLNIIDLANIDSLTTANCDCFLGASPFVAASSFFFFLPNISLPYFTARAAIAWLYKRPAL